MEFTETNDINIIQSLLRKKININMQNQFGITALMNASMNGETEIVRLLIEKGANTESKHIHWGATALHAASAKGHIEIVKLLLEGGANIESKNKFGETSILFPIAYRHTEIVKLLLEGGASLNVKDQNGNTPLHLAQTKTPGYDIDEDIIELVKGLSG